ncbi:hypothetical protein T12_1041 [Trichinella patagoniensis]|uniref:Uncharacterized protein n=1 Tax=Trichinella patagoniensis TaxID=990121 RepID=A0A0V0YSU9_9BILA|nr:hypothetical protein T12_1041 [Trichinella patagoniensis]
MQGASFLDSLSSILRRVSGCWNSIKFAVEIFAWAYCSCSIDVNVEHK